MALQPQTHRPPKAPKAPKCTKYFLFHRIKPQRGDDELLFASSEKMGACGGYWTYTTEADGVLRLSGYLVMPSLNKADNIARMLPNFMVRPMPYCFELPTDEDLIFFGVHPLEAVKKRLFHNETPDSINSNNIHDVSEKGDDETENEG